MNDIQDHSLSDFVTSINFLCHCSTIFIDAIAVPILIHGIPEHTGSDTDPKFTAKLNEIDQRALKKQALWPIHR
jgi:hypothetical protein